jgi:hypothetical protein
MSDYYRYLTGEHDFCDKQLLTTKIAHDNLNKNKQWKFEGKDLSFINDEIIRKTGCIMHVAELFYTAPHSKINWHIDTSGYTPIFDYVKINIVWGTDESHYMQWGKVIDENYVSDIQYNLATSPYLRFDPSQIEITESITIDKPILVNVGVPHRAVNDSDLGRWCLSLIPKKNDERIAWNQAIEIFHEYL